MNTRNLMHRLAVIGFAVATGCLSVPASAAPQDAVGPKTIRVLSAAAIDAASPQAAIWQKAPATEVPLQTAFPGYVSIVGTADTKEVTAQAVRADGRLYVRLSWTDPTANTAIKDTNQFVDGVAVQFPMNGKVSTTPFMGDSKNPVNVWHWTANGHVENLFAKGFGTLTAAPIAGLHGTAVRTENGWEVVFSRSLLAKPGLGVSLQGRRAIPIAFAVWDGNNQERDGLKAVTLQWWQLSF